MAHSRDFFDMVRVSPTETFRKLLLAPEHAEIDAVEARAELVGLVEEHLDRGPGVLVLTGFPADIEHGTRVVQRVSWLLGELLPQNREGKLVREVRDRGTAIGEGARARYSDSRFGGNMHTDGAEAPLPAPDVFTLFCVRQSADGGALRLVHVRDLRRELDAEAGLLDVLHGPFHFDRRGDQRPGEPPTTVKPVLFTQRARPSITYLRSYIESGHNHPGVPPLAPEQRAALDKLDEIAEADRNASIGKLREGELALFDNLSLLHGRTEFRDVPGHRRLLLRSWVRRAEGDEPRRRP
jgi:hypothetical protein